MKTTTVNGIQRKHSLIPNQSQRRDPSLFRVADSMALDIARIDACCHGMLDYMWKLVGHDEKFQPFYRVQNGYLQIFTEAVDSLAKKQEHLLQLIKSAPQRTAAASSETEPFPTDLQ